METEANGEIRKTVNNLSFPKLVIRAVGIVRDKNGNIKGDPYVQSTPIKED